MSDGLFLDVVRMVARQYPDIEYEESIVDATAMKLVLDPSRFDVLVGGLGLAPSANIGDNCAVFEAVHGSAPDIAGKGIANPTALILSGALMLRHLGEAQAAEKIERAVETVIGKGEVVTPDLGGSLKNNC